jgi:PTH1 family peptidyl-tRNA hydrolase
MEYVIVGLGNPGSEYEATRHNVGRMTVLALQEKWCTSDWRDDKKLHAKISQGVTSKGTKVRLVLPDNYMNRSGGSVVPLIKNKKQIERLIVVHDDIDLGVGTIRIVQNRGAGGHNGVRSIERALKSKAYIRVRLGVIPTTPTGKLKKPKGEKQVHDLILKPLTKKQKEEIDTIVARAVLATVSVVEDGVMQAMCAHNGTMVPSKTNNK